MPSISKIQTLTGSQVALTAFGTNGLILINSTAVALSFVANGGDVASLPSGQGVELDVNNANQITVSGTGSVSYIVRT
jgi:ethanolamine ammonia-lyase large subunit